MEVPGLSSPCFHAELAPGLCRVQRRDSLRLHATTGPFLTTEPAFWGTGQTTEQRGKCWFFQQQQTPKALLSTKWGSPAAISMLPKINQSRRMSCIWRDIEGPERESLKTMALLWALISHLPGLQINGNRAPQGLCLLTRPTPNLSSCSSIAFRYC